MNLSCQLLCWMSKFSKTEDGPLLRWNISSMWIKGHTSFICCFLQHETPCLALQKQRHAWWRAAKLPGDWPRHHLSTVQVLEIKVDKNAREWGHWFSIPYFKKKKVTTWKEMCESSSGKTYSNILYRNAGKHPRFSETELSIIVFRNRENYLES